MDAVITIGEALHEGRLRLGAHSDSPGLDAQRLLASVTHRPREWILSHPDALLDEKQAHAFRERLERLVRGEALAYILGEWPFYGRDFQVSPEVLIPRPETELLVEQALDYLRTRPARRLAVDVGTGCGCIAISLAAEIPDLRVICTDISPAATRLARENARRHGVGGRLDAVIADLLQPFTSKFDLICANLPYIPSPRLERLEVARREPRAALDGGPQGVTLTMRLVRQVATRLAPGGLAILEIDPGQEGILMLEVERHWPGARVEMRADLRGLARLLLIHHVG